MSMAGFTQKILATRFLRFALVGTAGFFVDAAVLFIALHLLHLDPYSGRALSFLCAVSFTWFGNRTLTFRDSAATGRRGMGREWAKFVSANAFGGAANYGLYAALVSFASPPLSNPFMALAAGAIAGLSINFLASKHFVFRGSGGV